MSLPTPVPRQSIWKYTEGLLPVAIVWIVLVGWLAALLYDRANWSEQADEAEMREWLDEARNFRKTLPELVREYADLRAEEPDGMESLRLMEKRKEIEDHMAGLAEPTRTYLNQLPSFPVIFKMEVVFAAPSDGSSDDQRIAWESPLPRPRQERESGIRVLEYRPLGDSRATIRCEYQVHAFNKLQRREEERRRISLVAGAVLVAATVLAGLFVFRFLQRERVRELLQLATKAEAEHHQRELLEIRVRQQDAERARDELDRKLLEQKLDAADLEHRASEAEKTALEMKSQLYASIGIMAGSYAHNIKNLLVRPNDLLARCIEVNGLNREQTGMLTEVRDTLGTVTERLQQILRTIRRDPTNAEMTRVDLNALARETAATWGDMAREKWKLTVTADGPAEPLWVRGDLSHLQQAIENLLFNARDATFEMRNHLREAARQDQTPNRKQRLIDAAGWRGRVDLSTALVGDHAVLEVRDNGIGMTDEVRENCLRTHFTTKRDNALYEGYSAGMGLGLSFVAVVLEHHGAKLDIESRPEKGALFRVHFPVAGGSGSDQSTSS